MKKRDPNIYRAEAIPHWPGCKDAWFVVLSVDDEDVADCKGRIVASYRDGESDISSGESRKVAKRAARSMNAAIRNAIRADRRTRS